MRKYQGMTFIGMLLTMAVVIFLAIILMRAVPVYLEHYSVIQSIESLSKIPATEFSNDPSSDATVLKNKLVNQLYVNSIVLPPDNIIVAPTQPSHFQVTVKYQVVKPLFANASLLFNFEDSKEVVISAK